MLLLRQCEHEAKQKLIYRIGASLGTTKNTLELLVHTLFFAGEHPNRM